MIERPLIEIRDLAVSLGGRQVLHGIGFAASAGEFVAICGPNGAGKTTLLKAMAGLLPGGRPCPKQIAYVEQAARSAWGITVREAVALGRTPHGDRDATAIETALAACGIAGLAGQRIDRISGGQARRAMLARALATEPTILLLDEPVSDLDPAAAHAIMALLASLAATGRLVVAILHAVDLASRYATRMVVLQDGRIAADGEPRSVAPQAAACFGLAWGTDPAPRLLGPADHAVALPQPPPHATRRQ